MLQGFYEETLLKFLDDGGALCYSILSKGVHNGVQIASYLILGRMLLALNGNLQIASLRSR